MICFSGLIADNIDSPIDLSISAGESAAVITSREIEKDALVRVILGFIPATEGLFTLNDEQPAFLKESEISSYRKRIGVLYNDGGFISNLNLWENLTLQIAFEGVHGRSEIEELGMSALERVGYRGSPTVLLSRLSLFQRRQVAFARALLANPPLMIYHSTFEGLSRPEKEHLSKLAWEYHEEGERTSLFLTSNPESLKGMNFNLTYSTGGASSP